MRLKWYWFPMRRRPMRVTFHMDHVGTALWTGLFGLALCWRGREWFCGVVRSGNGLIANEASPAPPQEDREP